MCNELSTYPTREPTPQEIMWFQTNVEASFLEIPHDRWDIIKNYPENRYGETLDEDPSPIYGKALVDFFRSSNLRLNPELEAELLDVPTGSNYRYQQLRYGYGFLKATSHLCRYIQFPVNSDRRSEIFFDKFVERMVDAKYKSYQDSDLDLIRTYKDHPVPKYGVEEAEVILSTLDIELPSGMAAFIAMLGTLISPKSERYGTLNNFNVTDARNVGICSDVEVFLKSIFPWKGHGPEYGSSSPQTTVYKDTNNNPIFLEKTKGFGNPSAINLVPITINGVYIAPGYIHGIQIGRDNLDQQISKSFGGVQLTLRDINTISGINPRRATVFVSSDENERQSAFHNIYGNSSCHGIYLEEFEKYSRDIIKFVE